MDEERRVGAGGEKDRREDESYGLAIFGSDIVGREAESLGSDLHLGYCK